MEYPIKMQSTDSSLVVEFTGHREGTVITSDGAIYTVGLSAADWTPHTDTDDWRPYIEEPQLKAGDWCLVDSMYKRIWLGDFNGKHLCVITGDEEKFRGGKYYATTIWSTAIPYVEDKPKCHICGSELDSLITNSKHTDGNYCSALCADRADFRFIKELEDDITK